MSGAVAQWLVCAPDDRVVAGSNPKASDTDSVSVAASKLGALGKFVYHTLRTAVVQVYFDKISGLSLLLWCL